MSLNSRVVQLFAVVESKNQQNQSRVNLYVEPCQSMKL